MNAEQVLSIIREPVSGDKPSIQGNRTEFAVGVMKLAACAFALPLLAGCNGRGAEALKANSGTGAASAATPLQRTAPISTATSTTSSTPLRAQASGVPSGPGLQVASFQTNDRSGTGVSSVSAGRSSTERDMPTTASGKFWKDLADRNILPLDKTAYQKIIKAGLIDPTKEMPTQFSGAVFESIMRDLSRRAGPSSKKYIEQIIKKARDGNVTGQISYDNVINCKPLYFQPPPVEKKTPTPPPTTREVAKGSLTILNYEFNINIKTVDNSDRRVTNNYNNDYSKLEIQLPEPQPTPVPPAATREVARTGGGNNNGWLGFLGLGGLADLLGHGGHNTTVVVNVPPKNVVPEPPSAGLAVTGLLALGALGALARRRPE